MSSSVHNNHHPLIIISGGISLRLILLLPEVTHKKSAAVLIGAVLLLAVLILILLRGEPGEHCPAVRPGLPLSGRVIVLDPGHGGYDPGVFRHRVAEKELNLAVSLVLRDYLQGGGARVVMTRETDHDLLTLPAAGPKKKLDMKNRLAIIRAAHPDLLISIHTNASPSPLWSGAQVFHKQDCTEGRKLAVLIQEELTRVLENTDRLAKGADYLILNESGVPAALVEIGFISNPHEARLLADERYRLRLAWAVYLGIISYFAS